MRGLTLGFLIALYAPTTVCVAAVPSRVIPGTNITTGGDTTVSSDERAVAPTRTTGTVESQERTAVTRNVVRTIPTDTSKSAETATRSAGRAVSTTRSQTPQDSARSNLEAAVHTVGRSQRTESASINANPAVRRMGLTLRPSTAEVGGRAILESGAQTGSNIASEISNLSPRIATIQTRKEEQKIDSASIAEAKGQLEQKAALNKSCQDQYNDCMDQFCAVIDTNQKRCSCSSNLAKYVKVEEAVKEANTKLNEIAQNIRYVGLSADEISAIMSATEAEEAMTDITDTTENRNLLSQIERMIKDPTTTASGAAYSVDSYGLLDIDLDFSSDDFSDLFSLDFLTGAGNSFSNLRGGELYKAAKKRCETVIKQCRDVGATSEQITGNYDLAIDKDCIAYEQGLNKMNETLVSNVRSATRMLQKARLAVLQNQNTYDAIGCIGALETCMKDDMVCGENYLKCLDPTKKYIDENGNVVLGTNINNIQKFMVDYSNAEIDSNKLRQAYGTTISDPTCAGEDANDGRCIMKYLLTKIGTQEDPTAEGLCRPVLDKCRAYTYDSRGRYLGFNDIVVNYVQRAMVNIKAAQHQIVADYASTCLNDIATCYNNQVSQITSWSATAASSSVYNIMRGACRNVALTCGYAVFSADEESCPSDNPNTCIESISNIFYQSLLCPDNSFYTGGYGTIAVNNTWGYVNFMCECNPGFVVFSGQCLPTCDIGGYNNSGVCDENAPCPLHSQAVNGSGNIYGGRCQCDTGFHPFSNTCLECPDNSVVVGYGGDVHDGQCKCNADQRYVATQNGTKCSRCPSNSHYVPATSSTPSHCVCENGTTWDDFRNQCITAPSQPQR